MPVILTAFGLTDYNLTKYTSFFYISDSLLQKRCTSTGHSSVFPLETDMSAFIKSDVQQLEISITTNIVPYVTQRMKFSVQKL